MLFSSIETATIIQLILLILLILLSTALRRGLPRRSEKALRKLYDFYNNTRITDHVIELPEPTIITRGLLELVILNRTTTTASWLITGETTSVTEIPFRDLCGEPLLIIKYQKRDFPVAIVTPAVKITRGAYKNIIITCLNTENFNVEKHLEVIYNEGFAKGYLSMVNGKGRIKLDWVHYVVGSVKPRTKLRTSIEICLSKKQQLKSHLCYPLLKTSKPGTVESIFEYPVIKRVLIGYISLGRLVERVEFNLNGTRLESIESLIKKFPYIFAVRNASVKLRVRGVFRTIAERTVPLD